MSKYIQLTQGQRTLVDDEDYDYLSQWKWRSKWSEGSNSYYAVRTAGKRPNRVQEYMARVIAKTPDDLECDHINHDTLDNRKENLRNVTHAHNTRNRRTYSSNLLGEKNISREDKAFRVTVIVGGVDVFSKRVPTLEDAIIVRNDALRKYHGEYAYIPATED